MHSTAPDVRTYLQHIPVDRVACLTELHELCLNTLIEYEEGMDYGIPCYKKDGKLEVAFASQKRYIALYIAKQTVVVLLFWACHAILQAQQAKWPAKPVGD